MSDWNHNICADCWKQKNPDRVAVTITSHPEHECCYCHMLNRDGIFVRDNPANFPPRCECPVAGCEHRETMTATRVINDLIRKGLLVQRFTELGYRYFYVTKPEAEPGSPEALEPQ